MFYLLHNLLRDTLIEHGGYRYIRVLRYVTFRTVFAALTAFVIVAYLGPVAIRLLTRRSAFSGNHTTDPDSLKRSREGKVGTPTMGGLVLLLGLLAGVGLWSDLGNYYVGVGIFVVLWLGALGFADDWVKLVRPGSNGLRMRTKLIFQVGLGLLVGFFLWQYQERIGFVGDGNKFALLFSKRLIEMSIYAFVFMAMLVIVASSNAVNLTDGLDGLAIGCTLMAGLAFTGLAYVAGHSQFSVYLGMPYVPRVWELTVLAGSLVGACLGFMWWNCHPAEVFMGDTGSLALGGTMGYLAVATRNELMLVVVGGVFVMEAGSVLLQVGSYKLRNKKRIFACAPYHHHLQARGWHENQITVRFWILSSLFAAVALALLKLR